ATIHSLVFFKSIISSYNLNGHLIRKLDDKLSLFEDYILELPVEDNVILLGEDKAEVENKVQEINQLFGCILNLIQNI
ncbi:MAG: hypothetical protein ABIV51_01800, partial [Saprospiraceae bacterium]